MKTMEELAFELDRVGAAQQCEQLMSVYVSLHMEMRHIEYMKLWAHRPDCKLEMPWGAYEGFEGVERCYLKDHGGPPAAGGEPGGHHQHQHRPPALPGRSGVQGLLRAPQRLPSPGGGPGHLHRGRLSGH